jgi:pilus assembly protein CpaE
MDDQRPEQPLQQGHFQRGGALRLATICLDAQSAQGLAEFTGSTPLVRLQDELGDYFMEDRELPAKWTRSSPCDICLIDFDRNRSRARETAEKIHASLPEVAIFAVSGDSQPELIIQAMRSGCSEYLLKPIAGEQLLQSMARIAGRRKESQGAGRMVAFVGAKGGVGVTMMATHVGAILAKSYSRRTLLVDLHPAFGDAELYLGVLKYQYSFRDLAANADRLDTDLLQSFVVHHRSGLDLLAAPGAPPSPSRANTERIGASIDFLRRCYEVVLIDCPPGVSEDTRQAIQRADEIYLIAVPEIAAVRNVARLLEYFTRSGPPDGKLGVVINRWSKRNTITDEQIEEAIHTPILWKLPNQYYEVLHAITDGDPTGRSSGSELARRLDQIAAQIAKKNGTPANAAKSGKGLLALLDR